MATEVVMPALGMAQETGRLVSWLKLEGSSVARGDPLMEVDTDKARVEVEAPATGIVAGIRVQADEEVPVGTVVAWIVAPGELVPDVAAPPAPAPTDAEAVATRPPAGAQERQTASAESVGPVGTDRVLASPLARRLAREAGAPLAGRRGRGPGGAILAVDVGSAPTGPPPDPVPGAGLRAQMARHTTQVWTQTPHFYLSREVGARRLGDWRAAVRRQTALPVTHTDLLLCCCAATISRHPALRRYWADGRVAEHPRLHLGLAIGTARGLLVGTIADADGLQLAALVAARQELVERAQTGRLRTADLEEACFTVSNLGMHEVDQFHAILTEHQSAILAVGRIQDRVVPRDGQVAIEPIVTLTLSCDHRVLDGIEGAAFLADLSAVIEEPMLLLEARPRLRDEAQQLGTAANAIDSNQDSP